MNVSSYIGIPYLSKGRTRSGCDCWGLVYLVYREQLGIILPEYNDSYTDSAEKQEVASVISNGKALWSKVSQPIVGDVALLKLNGLPVHIGVYIGCNDMLHIRKGVDANIQSLSKPFWRESLEGFYHYVG